MAKVVAGQMEIWKMARDFSTLSNSFASDTLRMMVNNQIQIQRDYPDVLPSHLSVKVAIESDTGKLVDNMS